MTGRKKAESTKLSQSELDIQVKAFLEKGGKIVEVQRGKSGYLNYSPSKQGSAPSKNV